MYWKLITNQTIRQSSDVYWKLITNQTIPDSIFHLCHATESDGMQIPHPIAALHKIEASELDASKPSQDQMLQSEETADRESVPNDVHDAHRVLEADAVKQRDFSST